MLFELVISPNRGKAVEIGIWEAAQRMLCLYGKFAERDCDARASYHEMEGDIAVAEGWRRAREIIPRLRRGEKPPDRSASD